MEAVAGIPLPELPFLILNKVKFATLGIECSAYESINGHYLAARKDKKTVAFLLSFTGANRTVVRIARYLREATGNYVIGIAGPHGDTLRQ